MPLEPTEREEHFFKAMVDAADGSTPEELEPTERKEHWYQEIIDAIKTGGGGGGGVLVVHDEGGTLDHTWQEIYDAEFAVLRIDNAVGMLFNITNADGYEVDFVTFVIGDSGSMAFDDPLGYLAITANDYPQMI